MCLFKPWPVSVCHHICLWLHLTMLIHIFYCKYPCVGALKIVTVKYARGVGWSHAQLNLCLKIQSCLRVFCPYGKNAWSSAYQPQVVRRCESCILSTWLEGMRGLGRCVKHDSLVYSIFIVEYYHNIYLSFFTLLGRTLKN